MDLYRLTIQDSQDSMQFDLLDAPINIEDVEGAVDNTVLSGDIFTDFLYLKKRWEQKWAIMCKDEYERLRGFYTRQWSLATVPSVKVTQGYLKNTEWEGQIFYINAPYGGEVSSLTKMTGDTFQQTISGKNLVGLTDNTVSKSGLTATVDGDTVTINGTATGLVNLCPANFNLDGMGGKKPAVTVFPISGSWTGGSIGVSLRDSSSSQLFFQQERYDGGQFNTNTLSASALASADHAFVFAGATTVFSNFKFKIMLSDSPVLETTYIPFVGGIPSPNPQYPQPVQTVTGTQTVAINGQAFPIDLGTIELCKLGDSQDSIYYDGANWTLEKQTITRQFNGDDTDINTQGWFNSSDTNATTQVVAINCRSALDGKFSEEDKSLMTHFYHVSGNLSPVSNGMFKTVTGTGYPDSIVYVRIAIAKSIAPDVNGAKSWIAANKPTIYMPKLTPTQTTITDQALIAQLEAVRTALIEGQNLVEVTANGSNLPAKSITLQGIEGRENPILPQTNVRIGLSDGGVLNACECRQNVTLSMRETA